MQLSEAGERFRKEVFVHQHGCNMVYNEEYLKYRKSQGLFESLRRVYGDVIGRRPNPRPFDMDGSWMNASSEKAGFMGTFQAL
jgi:hypothetical protein